MIIDTVSFYKMACTFFAMPRRTGIVHICLVLLTSSLTLATPHLSHFSIKSCHGTRHLTIRPLKRWNRKCELLAQSDRGCDKEKEWLQSVLYRTVQKSKVDRTVHTNSGWDCWLQYTCTVSYWVWEEAGSTCIFHFVRIIDTSSRTTAVLYRTCTRYHRILHVAYSIVYHAVLRCRCYQHSRLCTIVALTFLFLHLSFSSSFFVFIAFS